MSIIKQYHKDTDTTYVYESESYWDPELKQARSKRHCIGKIDTETGEMVPTGKRGRKKATKEPETASDKYSSLLSMYEESQKENRALSAKVTSLERELADAVRQIRKLQATAQKIEKLADEISVQ